MPLLSMVQLNTTCHIVKYWPFFPFVFQETFSWTPKNVTNMYNLIFYCLVWIPLLTLFQIFTQASAHLLQEASLSVLHSCSLTSEGKVLKILSSTIRPLLFSNLHSPSSTGRHSSRLPLSSSCVRLVSSPNREGRDCRQLFPRFNVRSFLHWNNSGGSASIYGKNDSIKGQRSENKVDWKYNHITLNVIYKNVGWI